MTKLDRKQVLKTLSTEYNFTFNIVLSFCLEPWNVCLLNVFDTVPLCLSVLTWSSRNLQKQTEYELSFVVLTQIIERHFVIH